MSISTAPLPAPPKKKGMGCLGCGCLVLVLLVLLFVALVAGGGYFGYTKALSVTSRTPAAIPSFNGTDDLYNTAQQKIVAFGNDIKNHQAATIQLSADEMNTLIAHNPNFIAQKAHLFVTLTDNRAQVQGSIPTDALTEGVAQGLVKGRYLNFDTTFDLGFNPDSKSLDLAFYHLQIGDQTMPKNLLPMLQGELNPLLNTELQMYPGAKDLLQQTKLIQIKDGELVIQTQ